MSQPVSGDGNPIIGAIAGVVVGAVVVGGAMALFQPGQNRPASTATPQPSVSIETVGANPTVVATASNTPQPSSVVTTLPQGSFVAVLRTMPKKNYSVEQATEYAASLAKNNRTPVVLDTDTVPGFKTPNAYVIGVIGLSSNDEVTHVCRDLERPRGDNCYARKIG